MKNFRLIGLMLFILMTGNSCKTYKSLERVKPKTDSASIAEQVQKLKPGDLIMVFEKSGSIKEMEYVITEEGVLRGFGAKGNQADLISIRLDDIVKIEAKKFNVGKSVLLTGAVVASAYLIVGIILLAAWSAQ
ncbi:hypothetical protein SAMN00777080_1009 [Aquiflexum balticum DSM 16537]|uniref:Uncharacterized protein n=1 Tax=Aquiflexum balticum DSM 16537 TaxID=758820 RepID=A0A1W2H0I6_9BACT|nr:hypothetical protein [Aquiflexum balticum]SMD42457.1 hypothetical protein SAMN00777080_1009 [Aquiflexum balticum DSM 16537]